MRTWGKNYAYPIKQNVFNRFLFSYEITVRVIYSGVGKAMEHVPRAPLFRGPLQGISRVNIPHLVKNVLPAHIIFSKPYHTPVLCLQTSKGPPKEQLQCVSKLTLLSQGPPTTAVIRRYSALQGSLTATALCKCLAFKEAHNSKCNV